MLVFGNADYKYRNKILPCVEFGVRLQTKSKKAELIFNLSSKPKKRTILRK